MAHPNDIEQNARERRAHDRSIVRRIRDAIKQVADDHPGTTVGQTCYEIAESIRVEFGELDL